MSFKGDFYEVNRFRLGVRLGERRPKIVVGALNPGMLRLAGELADGVLLNYLPASHVPWSVEQVREGGAATIYAYVHAGARAERDDGIEAARRDLFSYAVVDAYARNFERAGFADEVAEIRARHAAGDREGALAAVCDRMVDAIDVMGDAGHGARHRAGLRRRRASTCPCSCRCRGAPTGWRSRWPPWSRSNRLTRRTVPAMELAGKVIVVTGGASGIGRASRGASPPRARRVSSWPTSTRDGAAAVAAEIAAAQAASRWRCRRTWRSRPT